MKIIRTNLEIRVPTVLRKKVGETESRCGKEYYRELDEDVEVEDGEYYQFPVIVDNDGVQWLDASLFLFWKVEQNPHIDNKTLLSIASALKDFKEFCEMEEIDYLRAPRKIQRPPWLYRVYLLEKVEEEALSFSTLRGRMSAVAAFYQWLMEIRGVKFKYKMWKLEKLQVNYVDDYGVSHSKYVESKDLVRVPSGAVNQEEEGCIYDEGRLKPLTSNEQYALIDALNELENPEMLLGFYVALLTGARMQTVFTLRLRQFENKTLSENGEVKVRVGPGTLCDTKGNRVYYLYFPEWLFEQIKVYMQSVRAKHRREKASQFKNERDQYVFLTKLGRPYYLSKSDPYRKEYRNPPSGSSVRQFLYVALHDYMEKKGIKLNFSFHDLRATFAVNYLFGSANLSDMEIGPDDVIGLRSRLNGLRQRMGHKSLTVTERYLKFRDAARERSRVQTRFEEEMRRRLLERAV